MATKTYSNGAENLDADFLMMSGTQVGPFGGIPSRRADCANGSSANATPGQITG